LRLATEEPNPPSVLGVLVLVEVLDPASVERAGPSDQAVDDVTLLEKKLGEVGAILAGNTGHEGDLTIGRDLRVVDILSGVVEDGMHGGGIGLRGQEK
jgi:hypothetical protein